MRVATFEEHADKMIRDRRDEDMCYQDIVRDLEHAEEGNRPAVNALVSRLCGAFPQLEASLSPWVRLRNGFIVVWDKRTRLVHFAYHPTLQRPTVWRYVKEKRRTIKKEWCFWEAPQNQTDPSAVLSKDMLTYILTFCGCRDVLYMRSMNRTWKSAASNASLWSRRFLSIGVSDQEPTAQTFVDYVSGFETDEQFTRIGRAWLHSVGQPSSVQLYTGEKRQIHLLGHDLAAKWVDRWVGLGDDRTDVICWVNLGKLYVLSPTSQTGYNTMPIKRWLIKNVLKYCDDCYERRI
jgi:hypothetical protein